MRLFLNNKAEKCCISLMTSPLSSLLQAFCYLGSKAKTWGKNKQREGEISLFHAALLTNLYFLAVFNSWIAQQVTIAAPSKTVKLNHLDSNGRLALLRIFITYAVDNLVWETFKQWLKNNRKCNKFIEVKRFVNSWLTLQKQFFFQG